MNRSSFLHYAGRVFSTNLKYLLSPIQARQFSNKMVIEHKVKGYEEFTKLVEGLESSGQPIHVLFSGGKESNGQSWCPYCVKGICSLLMPNIYNIKLINFFSGAGYQGELKTCLRRESFRTCRCW